MQSPSGPHRKAVKHYHEPGDLHELTFSCYRRLPLLTNDDWRRRLSESIDRANERHGFALVAFVYMPEHVHLLVYPKGSECPIDALLKAIKRPFSTCIKQLLVDSSSQLLDRLTVQQRPGITTFRFWQEGPGYDRNLTEVSTTLSAIDYIHMNPVRRGLVERAMDWRWSSARYFADPTGALDPRIPKLSSIPAEWLDR